MHYFFLDTNVVFDYLGRLVRVVAVDESVVQAALNSAFADAEDAMQYFAALGVPNLVAIVTGD